MFYHILIEINIDLHSKMATKQGQWMKPEPTLEGISPLPMQEICKYLGVLDILNLGLVSKKVRHDTRCFTPIYEEKDDKKNYVVDKQYREEIVNKIPLFGQTETKDELSLIHI